MSVIYIGNLAYSSTAEDLGNFLSSNGFPANDVQLQFRDGRSKGWALVTIADPDVAVNCVSQLQGASLDGRQLRVKFDEAPGGQMYGGNSGNAGGNPVGGSPQPISSLALYVGNLPWSADDTVLFELFSAYNPAGATVQYGYDGRSRGYGIVEFSSTQDAEVAIANINGMDLEGRSLTVRFDQGRSAPRRRRGGNNDGKPTSSIYVRNVPQHMDWQGLKDLFAELAPEFATVKMGPDGVSRGWGTVRFAEPSIAADAIARFNGFEVDGYFLEVREDSKPSF